MSIYFRAVKSHIIQGRKFAHRSVCESDILPVSKHISLTQQTLNIQINKSGLNGVNDECAAFMACMALKGWANKNAQFYSRIRIPNHS